MEWLILVVQLVILAGFVALVVFARNYLPSYTKEKGKNLATREDIEEITDKIESVKTEYAKELEGLKSQLNAKFHAHTVRFEKEFECYREIWGSLVEVREAFGKYRFHVNSTAPGDVGLKESLSHRLTESISKLTLCYEQNRPFFSQSVYDIISKIVDKSSIQNLLTYDLHKLPQFDDSSDPQEIMRRVLADCDEIEEFMEEVRKAICCRIEQVDNFSNPPRQKDSMP